jgi:uncharacterized iron-regulated protein
MRIKYTFKLIAACMLLLRLQGLAQVGIEHYKIYSVKQAKEISLDEMISDFNAADVVFFGEEHNDSVAHYLEKACFELFSKQQNKNVALSMEMFDRDVQNVMNEYLSGAIREKNFNKDARVWSNYRDYKPMVEYAKENKLDVICANAAGRYSNLAGRKGQQALMDLPKLSHQNFAPLPYDTASGAYYKKLIALTSHEAPATNDTAKKALPVMSMGGFNLIMAQSLWDATMAYSIAEYLKSHQGKKVFQVNGRFHSDEGFAIVTQLLKYRPKTVIKIISASSDESFPNIDWEKFKQLGDYVIITDPKVPKTFKD